MPRFTPSSFVSRAALAGTVCLALSSCREAHSALAPVTEEAAGIAKIWWVFLVVCVAVYLVVIAVMLTAAMKNRERTREIPSPLKIENQAEHRTHRLVTGAAFATAVILLGLLGVDLWVQ